MSRLFAAGARLYRRYLNGELFAIRRLICPRCGVTHALLPEDVCAYRDLTLSALESALGSQGGPRDCARAAQQAGLAGAVELAAGSGHSKIRGPFSCWVLAGGGG
jgi:hypothetical protein